jgi:uncharacterized protein (UPF0210 family)
MGSTMSGLLRTVTLGLRASPRQPRVLVAHAHLFFATLERALAREGLALRTRRVVCQPVDELFRDPRTQAQEVADFASAVERGLGEQLWFCLPGPRYRAPGSRIEQLAFVPAILAATERVFTNTLVSSPAGIHRAAIAAVAETIRAIAAQDEQHQGNFRFAVMANVAANAPYFPAAYHDGNGGYSLAFELAELAQECCAEADTAEGRLALLRRRLLERLAPVARAAQAVSQATGLACKGIDLSLAPYPGARSSAVRAVEMLNGSKIGSYEFLFALFAINDMLRTLPVQLQRVGYNGTMLSVLEDSVLAQRVGEGAVGIKDLLLYATVCGCGLDMVPVPLATPAPRLAGLIDAVAAVAQKWNKPLIARLLPSSVDARGETRFDHPFIVNTRPLQLEAHAFCEAAEREVFFAPGRTAEPAPPGPPAEFAVA